MNSLDSGDINSAINADTLTDMLGTLQGFNSKNYSNTLRDIPWVLL